MGSIDRADWHYGGVYPSSLPKEGGGTHIGMYLTWIIMNDLIGTVHTENSASAILEVKNRKISGRDFLFEYCDGKFWNEDLTVEGQDFTLKYYLDPINDKKPYGQYIIDYEKTLASCLPSLYEVKDNWSNYDKISAVIDERFRNYKLLNSDVGGLSDNKKNNSKQMRLLSLVKDWWKRM
ncbi:hypothetical protein CLV84_4326 [Neolewinella xylanilytica]|uniref:DUF7832 domain-containing protein n=1 Tax=Neolewinella xylanilytica TaxID=1514080 RepID=A0A2S6HZY5_9BACT|nr:hypothetical protein [Neolewinella xylanilytica]PPK83806.1 hypothetical protein CLV84_4326 [Neolewinella xylanilytica]